MGNSSRGFASMSPEKQREIASKGGKAAHQKGTAHQFTSEEARAAGRKGGQASGVSRAKKSDKTVEQQSPQGQEPQQENQSQGQPGTRPDNQEHGHVGGDMEPQQRNEDEPAQTGE